MRTLTAEWSYFRPGESIYCDAPVMGLGRRALPRGPDRRQDDRADSDRRRRCSWFLLGVARGKIVRIRVVEGGKPTSPPDGHTIKCACSRRYEFEELEAGAKEEPA